MKDFKRKLEKIYARRRRTQAIRQAISDGCKKFIDGLKTIKNFIVSAFTIIFTVNERQIHAMRIEKQLKERKALNLPADTPENRREMAKLIRLYEWRAQTFSLEMSPTVPFCTLAILIAAACISDPLAGIGIILPDAPPAGSQVVFAFLYLAVIILIDHWIEVLLFRRVSDYRLALYLMMNPDDINPTAEKVLDCESVKHEIMQVSSSTAEDAIAEIRRPGMTFFS